MTAVRITPLDPAIFRDGKPFNNGSYARTMAFPFPSVLAGGMRTIAGAPNYANIPQLLKIRQQGPFLLAGPEGQPLALAMAAPSDAVPYELVETAEGPIRLAQLSAQALPAGWGAPLPPPLSEVLLGGENKKVSARMPAFWSWPFFESWLLRPGSQDVDPALIGPPKLPLSRRNHVAITPGTRTAEEGMLFSTTGLEFQAGDWSYSLYSCFHFPAGLPAPHLPLVHPIGGESRPAAWEATSYALPACPAQLRGAGTMRRYRLVLLTAGAFKQGWCPGWLASGEGSPPDHPAIRMKLIAASIARPLPISGWDMAKRGPKAARLLVPAGSVYLVESTSDLSPLWFQAISDDDQDRLDGFGQVAVGLAPTAKI